MNGVRFVNSDELRHYVPMSDHIPSKYSTPTSAKVQKVLDSTTDYQRDHLGTLEDGARGPITRGETEERW